MAETQKPRTDKPRPTFHLVRRDPGSDKLIDFETFTGEKTARRALTDDLIDAGWRFVELQPGQSYAETLAAKAATS